MEENLLYHTGESKIAFTSSFERTPVTHIRTPNHTIQAIPVIDSSQIEKSISC
jgi:hypothetical protein